MNVLLQRKLPRTRSAEEICTEKEAEAEDSKGYASDSTVSHPATSLLSTSPTRKKRRGKERGVALNEMHKARESKTSPPPGLLKASPPPRMHKTSPPPRLPPLNSSLLRMKSTGSILNTPDCTPTSALCESRESLLMNDHTTRHRRKSTNSHRKPPPPRVEPGHAMHRMRRGSVDAGVTRVCGACGGGGRVSPAPGKPPLHIKRAKTRDDPRYSGQERPVRCRHLSRSLKGEKDRGHHPKAPPHHEEYCVKSTLNRSLSFSSVGDYEGANARPNFDPIHASTSTSGSKWTVYGYF